MLFTELPLCNEVLDGLSAMNFTEATPIQEQAIPLILQKKDIIACAQTGTGKTAAFLLPLLHNLQSEKHAPNKVNAIIMLPTRELAQQIDQQMEGFSYFSPFSSVAVYGGSDGEAWSTQKQGLLKGAEVVIATPGRLLSHINLYDIDFSGVKYLILDEADRMLDMGFYDDIMKIVKLLPADRQTLLFSATMPPKIQSLANTILKDPAEIKIAVSRPPDTIMQSAYICNENQKTPIILSLFAKKKPNKVILFAGSKIKVKEVTKALKRLGVSVDEMHSDLEQIQRDKVMHEFKNDRVGILVATDIVSRGIDIDDISLIINYDVPHDSEDYVHRIGRTARAGEQGMAITLVSPEEQYKFKQIENFLEKNIFKIPIPAELGEAPEYKPEENRQRKSRFGRKTSQSRNRKSNHAPTRGQKRNRPNK
ncbi:MAG: DEAD/DEAH box helicase [Dysgonamonadaceae bacterium]|nr:DEAD/DEAH box helicase [Dysgonamonadaceae bacterium]MDD4727520.1 DEAD/DEAH box helicase [Dysgonamonadaceae bacterium]